MTGAQINSFLEILRAARWTVVVKEEDSVTLPLQLVTRYPDIPAAYLQFLGRVSVCANAAQNAWFLCASDYNADADDVATFRWNEWERMGRQSAEGDAEMSRNVSLFWDLHFPIMSSVHSDYAYIAICLAPWSHGQIVYGFAGYWEEPSVVCGSFEEFLQIFGDYVASATRGELACQTEVRRELWDFL